MLSYVHIGDDPTPWVPEQPVEASQLVAPTVAVPVLAPLRGTLLISARAASVALTGPGPAGAVPSDFDVLVESIYVPTATGVSQDFTGYRLPAGTDLAALQAQITTLMTEGTSQAIPLDGVPRPGTIVLNGATLPFVVLAQVNAKKPAQ